MVQVSREGSRWCFAGSPWPMRTTLVSLDADPDVMRFGTGGVLHDQIENEVLPAFLGYYQRYEDSASIGATVIRSCTARASCRPSVINASA